MVATRQTTSRLGARLGRIVTLPTVDKPIPKHRELYLATAMENSLWLARTIAEMMERNSGRTSGDILSLKHFPLPCDLLVHGTSNSAPATKDLVRVSVSEGTIALEFERISYQHGGGTQPGNKYPWKRLIVKGLYGIKACGWYVGLSGVFAASNDEKSDDYSEDGFHLFFSSLVVMERFFAASRIITSTAAFRETPKLWAIDASSSKAVSVKRKAVCRFGDKESPVLYNKSITSIRHVRNSQFSGQPLTLRRAA